MPIKYLKMTTFDTFDMFDQFMYRPKRLQVLDVKKLETIGETAMCRMICSSERTLQTFKMSYRGTNSCFSKFTMAQLAKCPNLKKVEFASLMEYI